MNLSGMIAPDTPRSVALDILKVISRIAARAALYVVAVAALCIASVVYAMQLWGSPELMLWLLISLAVVAFWAARLLWRLDNPITEFTQPRRLVSTHRVYSEKSSPSPLLNKLMDEMKRPGAAQ